MNQGDVIYDEFYEGDYLPWATALEVWEPIEDALKWLRQVEEIVAAELPEWLPELRDAGYVAVERR